MHLIFIIQNFTPYASVLTPTIFAYAYAPNPYAYSSTLYAQPVFVSAQYQYAPNPST